VKQNIVDYLYLEKHQIAGAEAFKLSDSGSQMALDMYHG
jgi:hypothetical protein